MSNKKISQLTEVVSNTGTDVLPVVQSNATYKTTLTKITTYIQSVISSAFVPKTDVVNNLTSTDIDKPLSAAQGKHLEDNKQAKITAINGYNGISGTESRANLNSDDISDVKTLASYVVAVIKDLKSQGILHD